MSRHLVLALSLALLTPLAAPAKPEKPAGQPAAKKAAAQPADQPAPKLGPDGKPNAAFIKAHESFVEIAKKGEAKVVFLGDSITQGWKGQQALFDKEFGKYNAANFGIGGDRTQHVLWRVENGEFDGIQPKAVVLMIGTNNSGVGTDTPQSIASGIEKIIKAIHQRTPETKVLLLAIFPRGATDTNNPGRTKNQKVNEIIAKLHDGKKIHFLDIGKKFLPPDGTLTKEVMHDLLHLTPKGYQIWADAIREPLAELTR